MHTVLVFDRIGLEVLVFTISFGSYALSIVAEKVYKKNSEYLEVVKKRPQFGIVAHTCSPSTWEAEAEQSCVGGQSRLHMELLSLTTETTTKIA